MSMVTAEHLHKVFGRFTAVQDATFSIEKGEIVGFLGPNGAGKTTTMKMLTGYLPPTAGTASIAGYAPLSTCPAYAATKAAMKSWGLSLRGMLKREGIWVNVICPGFVRSRITDRNTCPMPFFMEADRAAKIMLDRLDGNVGLIAFPWPMRFGVWLMSALPWRVSEFISGILPEKTSTGRCKGRESEKIAF